MYHTTWKPSDNNKPTMSSNNNGQITEHAKTKAVECPYVFQSTSSLCNDKLRYNSCINFKNKLKFPMNCLNCDKLLNDKFKLHSHNLYCKHATSPALSNCTLDKIDQTSQCDPNLYKIQFETSQDLEQFLNQMSSPQVSEIANMSQKKDAGPKIYKIPFVNQGAFTEWLKKVPENSKVSTATWVPMTSKDALNIATQEKYGAGGFCNNVYNIKCRNENDLKESGLSDKSKFTANTCSGNSDSHQSVSCNSDFPIQVRAETLCKNAKQIHQCPACLHFYKSKGSLCNHRSKYKGECLALKKNEMFPKYCSVCDKSFETRIKFSSHKRSCKPGKKLKVMNEPPSETVSEPPSEALSEPPIKALSEPPIATPVLLDKLGGRFWDVNTYFIQFHTEDDFADWLYLIEWKTETKFTAKRGVTTNKTGTNKYLSCRLNQKLRKSRKSAPTPKLNCPSKMNIKKNHLTRVISVTFNTFHNHDYKKWQQF